MERYKNKYLIDGILGLIIMGIFSGLMLFFNDSGIPDLIFSTIWYTLSMPSIVIIEIINSLLSTQILTGVYTVPFFIIYYLLLGILIGKLFRTPNKPLKIFSFIMWGTILIITGYTCALSISMNMNGDASFLPIITIPVIIILFITWLSVFSVVFNTKKIDLDEELANYAKEHNIEIKDIPIKDLRKIIFEFDLGKNYDPQKINDLLSILDDFDIEKEKILEKYKDRPKEEDNIQKLTQEINDLIRKNASRQAEIIGRETFKKINYFYPEEMPDIVDPEVYEKKYK